MASGWAICLPPSDIQCNDFLYRYPTVITVFSDDNTTYARRSFEASFRYCSSPISALTSSRARRSMWHIFVPPGCWWQWPYWQTMSAMVCRHLCWQRFRACRVYSNPGMDVAGMIGFFSLLISLDLLAAHGTGRRLLGCLRRRSNNQLVCP